MIIATLGTFDWLAGIHERSERVRIHGLAIISPRHCSNAH